MDGREPWHTAVCELASQAQQDSSNSIKMYFLQKYFMVDCIKGLLKIYEDFDSVLTVFKTFINIIDKL